MANSVDQVIIEFIADTDALAPAVDKLEKLGTIDKKTADTFKASNAELAKRAKIVGDQAAAIDKLTSENKKLQKTIEDIDKKFKHFADEFVAGFREGIIAEFKKAGISAEDFFKKFGQGTDNTAKASGSLRSQLRSLTEEMTKLKLAGQENTEQYRKLQKEAGNLKDAMADVQQEIRGVGSDTRVFDGLISAAQGVAGGFAVAQGAAALFGNESKQLQETLLRVNAAMAILQGLQQVQNVLQKESAASLLVTSIRQKAFAASTAATTGIMRALGLATVQTSFAFKALRTTLITTGIGILLVGLGFLIEKLISFTSTTDDAAEAQKQLAESIRDAARAARDAGNEFLQNEEKLSVARAKAAGKTEQEIFNIQQSYLKKRIDAQERFVAQLSGAGDEQLAAEQELDRLRTELQVNALDRQTELNKKAAENQKKHAAELREIEDRRLKDVIAGIERQLLKVGAGTQEEVDLQKKLIRAKADLDLNAEKLTANQKKLINEKALKDQLDLQKDFNKKSSDIALQGLIDRNSAELAQVNVSSEERLRLQIENITTAAQIEINAAEGNASKIKAIIAKREEDIRLIKIEAINKAADDEIALADANNGRIKRAIERRLNDERITLAERLSLIDQLTDYELDANETRFDALNELHDQKLISEEDFNLKYAELVDARSKIEEDALARRADAEERANQERVRRNEEFIQNTITTTQLAIQTLDAYFALQSERENLHLAEEKKKVQELREAGAITEKEAIARMKKLDAEERKIKFQQAQRDKQIAVFNALIAIPAAYLRGLKDGGLPLAIIYGALAAAQAVFVASRPLPKFKKGKKDSYQGYGEVGEAGAEIVEKDGRMFVVEKPTIVWLGKKDKVYTPMETKSMMKSMPSVDKKLMASSATSHHGFSIDYEKFGDQVAKKMPQTILNITDKGMSELVKQGNSITEYLEKRRAWR